MRLKMKDKLLEIISFYGIDKQLKYIHSEYFELDEAIIQKEYPAIVKGHKNEQLDILENKHIAEELADVMVMLKQFQYYYGISEEEIEKIMNEKIDRQLERIKKNDEDTIKWLKEHNENAFKKHNILEIEEPKEVVVIKKEEYESLKEENQRLNNDIKVLLKENESKEKVIMKYENVLNELEKWLKDVDVFQMNFIKNKDHITPYKAVLDKLNELKESDK
jgi:hypothetical protein